MCSLSSSEQRGQELDSQTLECNGSWAPERFTTALFSPQFCGGLRGPSGAAEAACTVVVVPSSL